MSDLLLLDRRWITRGAERSSTVRFALWLVPWIFLLGLGIYAAGLCLYYGLNQTNMDNRFAFGMWIFADLAIIAMGAGAFFTGFLVYILKQEDLKPVLNSAVVIGLTCYSGAVAVLMVDVGQPLRAWFTFWHPNTHSMLTEVTFCISCYLLVLILEYIPVLLRNRQLRKVPSSPFSIRVPSEDSTACCAAALSYTVKVSPFGRPPSFSSFSLPSP